MSFPICYTRTYFAKQSTMWMNEHIKRKIMDGKVACKSFNTNNKSCQK